MQNTQFEYFKIEADESDETPKFNGNYVPNSVC